MLNHQHGFSTVDLMASRAVDGNTNADANGGSCLVTQGAQQREWFAIDLLDVYLVKTVVVYNRADCCGKFSWKKIRGQLILRSWRFALTRVN